MCVCGGVLGDGGVCEGEGVGGELCVEGETGIEGGEGGGVGRGFPPDDGILDRVIRTVTGVTGVTDLSTTTDGLDASHVVAAGQLFEEKVCVSGSRDEAGADEKNMRSKSRSAKICSRENEARSHTRTQGFDPHIDGGGVCIAWRGEYSALCPATSYRSALPDRR